MASSRVDASMRGTIRLCDEKRAMPTRRGSVRDGRSPVQCGASVGSKRMRAQLGQVCSSLPRRTAWTWLIGSFMPHIAQLPL